jgi:small conductance mechanosensitive channel
VGELLRTTLGARIAEAALAVGLILVITSVAWHVAGLLVVRLLTLAAGRRRDERTVRRVDALVPLMRSVLQMIIGVLAALLILSELGVNIAPLLAGAGILGLAVGFGAQTLVKDLITGVTILLEDGATVGDVVEVAGHAGVVEEMRIRVIELRDLAGAVHLIPYSEVTSIINHTQDFSFHLMEVGVAYREDTDEVCGVLNEISDEMRRDDTFGPDILEPLEILGVDKFADSAVVIKARLKTKPGRQWATGREFNRRMKQQFDRRGIEIPFPHTTVYFGEPKQGKAPPARLAIDDSSKQEVSEATSSDQQG